MNPHDSELKRMYDEISRRRAAGDIPEDEAERDLDVLRRLYEENMALRRRGQLTEPGPLEAAEKFIRQETTFYGVPVAVGKEEVDPEWTHFANRYWRLMAVYDGKVEDFKEPRWDALVEKLNAGLREIPGLNVEWENSGNATMVREKDLAALGPRAGMSDEEWERRAAPLSVKGAIWIIDTFVWDGPPKRRR